MPRVARLAPTLCLWLCLFGTPAASFAANATDGETSRLRVLQDSGNDFAVALAAHRRGDLDAAVRGYGLAIAKDPGFVEATVNLARALADQGELDKAERWLDRASAARSDYYAIYKVSGLVALRRGRLALAVQELERARALRGEDPEILSNLGAALLSQGRRAEAGEILEQAARLAPGSARTALNLALARDRGVDRGRAAYHYRRFLDLAGDDDPRRGPVRRRLELLADPSPPDRSVPTGSSR